MRKAVTVAVVLAGLGYLWVVYERTNPALLMTYPGQFYSKAVMVAATVGVIVWLIHTFGDTLDRLFAGPVVARGWFHISRGWWPTIIWSAILGVSAVAVVQGDAGLRENRSHYYYILVGLPVWWALRFLVDLIIVHAATHKPEA